MKQVTEFSGVTFRAALAAGEADEAITAATGLTGDRLARLKEALPLFKDTADKLRLVRVFNKDDAPKQVQLVGDFAYTAENLVVAAKAAGGKGGKRGGGRRPGGRPGQGKPGDEGDNSDLTGRFSMDTVAQDRKRKLASSGDRSGHRPGGPGGRGPKRGPGRSRPPTAVAVARPLKPEPA